MVQTLEAIRTLEATVLGASDLAGIVLRYGALGARPPRRIPVWLGRLAAGEAGVRMVTQQRGSS